MKYLSICSGIEAASAAWHSLGWQPLAFSEIETFPRAVLAHHYPKVPVHGDFTQLRDQAWIEDADVLVGGTPCQAFSVAGLRKSLSDDRGNLSLEFVRLADAIDNIRADRRRDPCVIVWENVPGVLSVKDNAFGCFLAGLAGDVTPYVPPRGKWTDAGVVDGPQRTVTWRVLDAQYFGLAQRRRRVFVVASARKGFDPAAVLLEFEGVRRDTPPSREAGKGIAGTIEASLGRSRGAGTPPGALSASTGDISHCLNAGGMGRQDYETETLVTHSLRAEGFDASEDGTGRGTPLVPVTIAVNETVGTLCAEAGPNTHGSRGVSGSQTMLSGYIQPVTYRTTGNDGCETGNGDAAPCVALSFKPGQSEAAGGTFVTEEFTPTLQAQNNGSTAVPAVMHHMAVRRLTPVECERLQGFTDGYTNIPWRGKPEAPDGPRYKALGNSMAVPVMRWIGRRIAEQVK